uniref:Cyclin-dependent kinase inhibitor 1A n=1 Tax=Nothobranchius kadleci TaxID=1051664 RepID=A0A1A8DEW8_NOTKA
MCRGMATLHKRALSTLRRNGPPRRSLFGPVDREQLQMEYRTALRKDLEEASQRWGFDFFSDKPLESGDFQWEIVPGTRVPLPYRSSVICAGHAEGQRSSGATKRGRVVVPEREKENFPQTLEKCSLSLENMETTSETEDKSGMKRKQTNITDFYQAKRRVVWLPRKSGE